MEETASLSFLGSAYFNMSAYRAKIPLCSNLEQFGLWYEYQNGVQMESGSIPFGSTGAMKCPLVDGWGAGGAGTLLLRVMKRRNVSMVQKDLMHDLHH